MAHFQRRIVIEAPVHQVFEYWRNPGNWPEVWPGLIDVTDLVVNPDGVGTTYRWLAKLAGKRFRGWGEFVEFVPDRRIVLHSSGGVDSVFKWTFERQGTRTKMTADVSYTVPAPLIGQVSEPFVLKTNEFEVQNTLANLMARMEHRPSARAVRTW